MKYLSCDPNCEVRGGIIKGFLESVNADHIIPVLQKYGLDLISTDSWVSLQDWLHALGEIAQAPNAASNFVSSGLMMAENFSRTARASELSLQQVLEYLDTNYQHGHRGGDCGGYDVEVVAPGHAIVTARTPYPSDYIYGLLYGVAKTWAEGDFLVEYDPDADRPEEGGGAAVYHVTWH